MYKLVHIGILLLIKLEVKGYKIVLINDIGFKYKFRK